MDRNKAPETAVMRIVAVVTHDKKRVCRHCDRPEVVAEVQGFGVNDGILECRMRVGHRFLVDEELFVPDFHHVACHRDDPFDVVEFWIFGVLKNNDITRSRVCARNQGLSGEGQFDAVRKLAHQNIVANLQGWQHGTAGDLEGLNNKGADEQHCKKGYAKRLEVFAKGGTAPAG